MLSLNFKDLHQSSIVVAVRVRPFTEDEQVHLICDESDQNSSLEIGDTKLSLPTGQFEDEKDVAGADCVRIRPPAMVRPDGIRKVVECVDDKMLIFDPADSNPLNRVSDTVLNSMYSLKRASRRRLRRNSGEVKFVFDKLFDQHSTQQQVYESTTSPLLDSVLDGFNSTVFAYGATGCGKTHTVSGTSEEPGIIFQAMQELYIKIDDLSDTKNFEISLSYLEIYNETIRDLLNPDISSKKLVIRENSEDRITVANLSLHKPRNVQDVMDLVVKGNMNRTTSPTDANETSSRSHAVLQIHIMQSDKSMDLTMNHTFATLSVIDLAGSERAASTRNRGQRLHEGANINRSLLALGNCINALCLSDGTRRSCHVPYRDSKLTRLLKFSLGGNCKTVMIVCISPSSTHYDETLNTLKYANRAKAIRTKVIRNQQSLDRHVGSYLKTISEQKKEIDQLRSREATIIELNIQRYKVSQEKIYMAIEECVSNVIKNYETMENFQNSKIIKALILCKRRFLQLMKLELKNLTEIMGDQATLPDTMSNCKLLKDQLQTKIFELETKFDTPDELDMAIKNCREVSLRKLQEMENWNNVRNLAFFQAKLEQVSDSVRNEILVQSSMMFERLLEDEILSRRLKFLSNCVIQNFDIEDAVNDLIKIDEEFDTFGQVFLNHNRAPVPSAYSAPSSFPLPVMKTVRWLDAPPIEQEEYTKQSSPLPQSPLPVPLQDPAEIDVSMQDISLLPPEPKPRNKNPTRNSLLTLQLLSNSHANPTSS